MAEAMNVADYVITSANRMIKKDKNNSKHFYPVTNLSLQKMLYFLNTLHFLKEGNLSKPLISNEKFETWVYGPVLYDVYAEYSRFGGNPIMKPIKHLIGFDFSNKDDPIPKMSDPSDVKLAPIYERFIDKFLKYLLKCDPFKLVSFSHMEPQWRRKKSLQQKYNDNKTYQFYKDDPLGKKIISDILSVG